MPKTLFYPIQIKNLLRRAPSMCQSLVQLAEVIPTSSGRSSYPPSALTRSRLAPSLQSAIPSRYMASFRFFQRWLKAVLPFYFKLLKSNRIGLNYKCSNFVYCELSLIIRFNIKSIWCVIFKLP